jgi:ribosomal-protein-alanine acetyltransferase
MATVIEDALISHLDRLVEIENECFREDTFTKEQIAELLKEYNCVGLVARVDKTIVGFVIGMIYIDRKALYGHILTIDVLPMYRRRGIGNKLLQEMERIFEQKGVRASYLEVKEDNAAAVNLYRKSGYQKIDKLAGYYGKTNGIYFRKALT